ncbi:uncharacterized protein B0H18DRAFT_977458 [Fomitopsis serialis]|uniref:uncharacterized protein n=1 Tax=Fomitopsis serialis TaxID=139415 RepID=UPI00200838CA|nr:uncharacterized protein B0H18DRAFT_977458 [Neoantrodia serialis]KAH9934630.1 hypothetical protein B0H18DRAFT_977458 [Neoantrodia serialis]
MPFIFSYLFGLTSTSSNNLSSTGSCPTLHPQKSDTAEDVPNQAPADFQSTEDRRQRQLPTRPPKGSRWFMIGTQTNERWRVYRAGRYDDNDMPPLGTVGDSDDEEDYSRPWHSARDYEYTLASPPPSSSANDDNESTDGAEHTGSESDGENSETDDDTASDVSDDEDGNDSWPELSGDDAGVNDVDDDDESNSDEEPVHGEGTAGQTSSDKAELTRGEAAGSPEPGADSELQSDSSDDAKPVDETPRTAKQRRIQAALAAIEASGLKPAAQWEAEDVYPQRRQDLRHRAVHSERPLEWEEVACRGAHPTAQVKPRGGGRTR